MERILSLLIVVTNLLILYDLQQLKAFIHDGSIGPYINMTILGIFTLINLVKKPIEVVDFRPSKNIDLK
jgi:cell division protein ZapA (FtsZ GTPase activity inhibitor)